MEPPPPERLARRVPRAWPNRQPRPDNPGLSATTQGLMILGKVRSRSIKEEERHHEDKAFAIFVNRRRNVSGSRRRGFPARPALRRPRQRREGPGGQEGRHVSLGARKGFGGDPRAGQSRGPEDCRQPADEKLGGGPAGECRY